MTTDTPCPDDQAMRELLLGLTGRTAASDDLSDHFGRCPHCAARAAAIDAPGDGLVEAVRSAVASAGSPTQVIPSAILARLRQLPREGRGCGRHDPLDRVGPYRIERTLGRGGMGVVYLAYHDRASRPVALKVLPPDAPPERLARFQRETEATTALRHPNIVRVYEVGEAAGRPFLAMEYVAGGTLAARLARGSLDQAGAAASIGAAARAVETAHRHGVIHRDLKPGNILLDPQEGPKVADFGLVKYREEARGPAFETESGILLGTPAYMAPEQAAGGTGAGAAVDVYGLGAILYECLTGRPPFTAPTVLETLEQVRMNDPVPVRRLRPAVARDLETVCHRCLEKNPARRYGSAGDLADDLDRFLRGEPVRARPVGVATRVRKWAIRRPTAAALLAACAVSVAALGIVTAVYTTRLRESAEQADRSAGAARRQQALARGNYRAARDALRQMLARLQDRRAGEIPRLMELRREQLEDALAFHTSVLGQMDDPDPEARLDAAVARVEVGSIQYDLGQRASAAATFRLAAAQLEQLPADYRTRSTARVYLIQCYNYLANLGDGGADEAEGYFLKARAEATEHAADDPADPARHKLVAVAEHNLGTLFQNRRQTGRAEQHYLRALEILTRLTGPHPGNEAFAVSRAETLLNLGLIYLHTDRAGPAGTAFRDAEALLQPLVNAHPGHERYALSLAGVHINWGNLLRFTGDLPGAIARFDRAVELADVVLKREPEYITARERATEAHGARAFALTAAGRARDAVPDWDVVIEFVDPASRNRYRVCRAVALAAGGWHDRAAAEANEVAAAPGLADEARYDLACALSLAAEAARTDPALGYFGRTARVESRAAAAVAVLRQLHAAGFFRQPAVAKHLGEDPDLKPLHDRPDFRRLLAEVGQEK